MKSSRRLVVSAFLGSVALLAFSLPSHAQTAVDEIFDYTGANQSFLVPTGVTSLRVRLWGGGGADDGGGAAFVTGLLSVTPGETLTLIVAGGGLDFHGTLAGAGPGGFGGGGLGGFTGGGGGGRSAIRDSAGVERVTAAGGGGGSEVGSGRGGYGGLAVGGAATDIYGNHNVDHDGQGGTQTEGGTPGQYGSTPGSAFQGGAGAPMVGGGGGGGYFGGGGGYGGGGGSSFLDNLTDSGASERGGGSSVFFDYMLAHGADPQYLLDHPNDWYYLPGGIFDPFGAGQGTGGHEGASGAPGRIVLSYTLSASASAPEPTTAALLALGALAGARVRRSVYRKN